MTGMTVAEWDFVATKMLLANPPPTHAEHIDFSQIFTMPLWGQGCIALRRQIGAYPLGEQDGTDLEKAIKRALGVHNYATEG